MSVNVFADFNITTLDCELSRTKHPNFFSSKLSLRIDEKRKTMRLNLLPEVSYSSDLGYLYDASFFFIMNHTIELNIDNLNFELRKKNLKGNEFLIA